MTGLQDSKSLTLRNEKIDYLMSNEYKYKKWIELEKTVAKVQADLNIIPHDAYVAINEEVNFNNFTQSKYNQNLEKIGHGFYSFVETILEGTSNTVKKYFHFGLTTQNIQQSSQVLIIRDINLEFNKQLFQIISNLTDLASQHSNSLIAARTHSKHAMPTTFGYIVSTWIEELITAIENYQFACKSFEEIMFGGAIGSFNSLGPIGKQMHEKIGNELNIRSMNIPSRNIQLPKIQYISSIILIANVLHKIAEATYNNSTEEISEFTESSDENQVGSSTMPHKINPKLSKGIIANSMKIYSLIDSSLYANTKPYEANSASYMILDANINEVIGYFNEVLIRSVSLSSTLQFHSEKARQNILDNDGLDNSEYIMMKLSDVFGKYDAHRIIHDVAISYQNNRQISYLESLHQNPEINDLFSKEEIEEWLKPENYTGLSEELTNETVDRANEWLKKKENES